jgi:repressor LexA
MAANDDGAENRLRKMRLSKGYTLAQLGALAGLHLTTIAKFERGERPLSGDMLMRLATALGVSPTELVDTPPATMPIRMVPLVGKIAAGNYKEAILDPIGHVPAPVGGPNVFGLRPDGDSMDLIVGPDAIILVDPDDFELRDGRIYAVMNGDGETTFKRYRGDPPRLEPCSSNPIHKPISLGREPFTVVGRVVWQGSQL